MVIGSKFFSKFSKAAAITVTSIIISSIMAFPAVAFGAEFGNDDDPGGDKTLAPYFFVESEDASVDGFPLKQTDVTANINGVVADIHVVQTYANEGDIPINATYVFPAGAGAAVHGMTMQVGDVIVAAQIKEREEAREIYEVAKTEGKNAALLEQQRPNVFTMDLANIMPGDIVKVELHYSEVVVPTEGVYEFVFPTVVGPRYSNQPESGAPRSDQWIASPYLHEGKTTQDGYNIDVSLSMGMPISALKCKSHEVLVNWEGGSAAEIALKNPEDYAGNRDFILEYKLTGKEIQTGMTLDAGGPENFFMLMVQPPERIIPEDIPPREYIFVLDVSGSMSGYPIETAKRLIKNLVSGLRKDDLFNLILFSGASSELAPKPVKATEKNITDAIRLIDRTGAGGGTELCPALLKAVGNPIGENTSRNVVVITDGYIGAEAEVFDIIGENLSQTSFFSFGIGESVNRLLIDGIAAAGMGEPFVAINGNDADRTADLFREYIASPVLTDINVEFDGFEAYDVEPQAIPVLFAQRPITLLGKWSGEPTGSVRITGKSGGKDYVREIRLSDIAKKQTDTAIGLLWAREKVQRLTSYGVVPVYEDDADESGVRREVTEIGLKYSLMTPYTSFVAVIETVRNEGGEGADVKQPLPMPAGVSDMAIGGGSEAESIVPGSPMDSAPMGSVPTMPGEVPAGPGAGLMPESVASAGTPVLVTALIAVAAGGLAVAVWFIRRKRRGAAEAIQHFSGLPRRFAHRNDERGSLSDTL